MKLLYACCTRWVTVHSGCTHLLSFIRLEGPKDRHLRNSSFRRRSRDLAYASIPLAQTPWGLTGRAWLQAGAQRAVIVVVPSFNSLGIDSRNVGPQGWPIRSRVLGCSYGCETGHRLGGITTVLPAKLSKSYITRVATICHQVCCICWGHLSGFHATTSLRLLSL